MKLNWFSPLQPASTDIAHYTGRVLAALVKRADVTLWTDQSEWDASLDKLAEVRRYQVDQMDWAELNRADMSVYNIGNNPLFHGAIWRVSREHPGIVVLHDLRLHHFFDGLYRVQWRDLDAYLRVMESYYGETGRSAAAECFQTDARNIDVMAERYPLTLHALESALGAVVHTREAFDVLKMDDERPLAYLPLPFASLRRHEKSEAVMIDKLARRDETAPFRLVVFGYVGKNRRLEQLLKALAEFPSREKFRLDIYGELWDSRQVRALVRSLGLKKLVMLRGFVPENELDRALAASHLAINLRYPTMGEASGSQLRIWSHSLPSLVTEVGWYATLPADAVAFVRPEDEIEDIQKHLRAFLSDPSRFARMGARGRLILEQEHAPEAYAAALVDFVKLTQSFRPRALSLKLAERAGALMSEWTSPHHETEAMKKAATEIYALAGKGGKKQGEE